MAIDREKVIQSAQKYIDKRKYDRALEEYQRIVREEPNDTRTLLKIGDLQTKLQVFADAMTTYDRVAQLYEAQGFAVKAVAIYKQIRDHIQKRAPELADRFSHVTPRLAKIYAQLQLTSDAILAYDEVATRLLKQGKRVEAIDTFREMVRLDTLNPLTHVRLAEALCSTEDVEGGLDSFVHAIELLQKLGRKEDALRVVDRAYHLKPDARVARLAAEVYLQRGERSDLMQALSRLHYCFEADPKDLGILGMLAQTFTLLGQPEKSIEVYKQMAMLAREKGEQQTFVQLVEHLVQVAPDDDQVKAFRIVAQQPAAAPSRAPDPMPEPPAPEPEEEFVDLDDEVEFFDDAAPASAAAKAPAEFDATAHARKATIDADSFRRLRLFDKAAETLRLALELDPRNLDIRFKLREVLYEASDVDGMLGESLAVAIILHEQGYAHEAAPFVEEVLASDPENPDAIQLYTVIFGQAPTFAPEEPSSHAAAPAKAGEPLPSYDLEDPRSALNAVDDPFGEVSDSVAPNALPSFSLDEPDAFASEAPTHAAQQEPTAGLEEILDEAEFFAARGLFEDARAILEEQLTRTPNHPLVLEKLRDLAESALGTGHHGQSGDRSHVGPSQQPDDEDADEFEASLRALDSLEMTGQREEEVVDIDKVFATFKASSATQVDASDSTTHYDLGVAYKEMGLVADALKEFELAAADPQRECMCYAMIGLIQLEQNHLDEAIRSYRRGLECPQRTHEQELSLHYDLGVSFELKNQPAEAVHYFRKIARKDPNYRDVTDRIAALEHSGTNVAPPAHVPTARAVNGEDDFDQAFDDMFRDG